MYHSLKIRRMEAHVVDFHRAELRRSSVCPAIFLYVNSRLDFRRSLVSGLRPSPLPSGEERGLLSRTAAGDRAYVNSNSNRSAGVDLVESLQVAWFRLSITEWGRSALEWG